MSDSRLGIGFIGSGFNARFHMQAFRGVRDADVYWVCGVRTPKNAASAARYARELDVGQAKAYKSITDMVADPGIDAIWLNGPNQARIENVEEICDAVTSGKGTTQGYCVRETTGAQCDRSKTGVQAGRESRHQTRLSRESGICTANHDGLQSCCGNAAPLQPVVRISRARPRNTADHTCRGSGTARCRGAAY